MREKKAVSMRDVAKAVGVSSTTVSLVLNGRASEYHLSERVQKLVVEKAAEMNYSPTRNRKGRRRLLISGLGDVYMLNHSGIMMDLLAPLTSKLESIGWQLTLTPLSPEGSFGVTTKMLKQSTAVLIPSRGGTTDMAKDMVKLALDHHVIPLVIGRLYPDIDAIYFDSDNIATGRMVAEYLYNLGHTRVAVMKGISGDDHSELRTRGFADFFEQKGHPLPPEMIWGDGLYWVPKAYDLTREKIRQGLRPTAIFYVSDMMAIGGLYALREQGLSVPDDVSIIGHDDETGLIGLEPGLTTIKLEVGDIGTRLAAVLSEMAHTGKIGKMQVLCPVKLVERQTTARAKSNP